MLEQVAHYNDLSPKLREKLEKKIAQFGKKVKYRFNIDRPNPDPEKYNGDTIWPYLYTLDPIVFDIVDNDEKRDGKQKVKKVGLVNKVNDRGIPESFHRIRVHGREKGILTLDLTNPEDIRRAMILELHPKLIEGDFKDPNKQQVFSRVDEKKEAAASKSTRAEKHKALQIAFAMKEEQVYEFARAMQWDTTDDPVILREKIEAMAEANPKMFSDLANTKKVEYLSTIKKATDDLVIMIDPIGGRVSWPTGEMIAQLSVTDDRNINDVLADWFMTNGQTAEEIYKKIKSQV